MQKENFGDKLKKILRKIFYKQPKVSTTEGSNNLQPQMSDEPIQQVGTPEQMAQPGEALTNSNVAPNINVVESNVQEKPVSFPSEGEEFTSSPEENLANIGTLPAMGTEEQGPQEKIDVVPDNPVSMPTEGEEFKPAEPTNTPDVLTTPAIGTEEQGPQETPSVVPDAPVSMPSEGEEFKPVEPVNAPDVLTAPAIGTEEQGPQETPSIVPDTPVSFPSEGEEIKPVEPDTPADIFTAPAIGTEEQGPQETISVTPETPISMPSEGEEFKSSPEMPEVIAPQETSNEPELLFGDNTQNTNTSAETPTVNEVNPEIQKLWEEGPKDYGVVGGIVEDKPEEVQEQPLMFGDLTDPINTQVQAPAQNIDQNNQTLPHFPGVDPDFGEQGGPSAPTLK